MLGSGQIRDYVVHSQSSKRYPSFLHRIFYVYLSNRYYHVLEIHIVNNHVKSTVCIMKYLVYIHIFLYIENTPRL